jgi:hypothetical protein
MILISLQQAKSELDSNYSHPLGQLSDSFAFFCLSIQGYSTT